MAASLATERRLPGAMTPVPHRVVSSVPETEDTVTIELAPLGLPIRPEPGQFVMLYAFGVGEVPISTSGPASSDGLLRHTVRAVGPVSRTLAALEPGDLVGARGPFGTTWPLEAAEGGDLVVVAGGIGLAPLRPAVLRALERRDAFGRISVLVGARLPGDLLYRGELERWREAGVQVEVTVDAAAGDWRGRVGLVTRLLPLAAFEPGSTTALLCGPEVMMAATARALSERGVPAARTWVSFERNMQCGVGHCGHCQVGPVLVCRDGPVLPLAEVATLLTVREL
jgi:anaerobic sulfite reductase subunit B